MHTDANLTSSKWIAVSDTCAPASQIARQALALRLDRVQAFLPLAAHEYEHDMEYVHQLRVSCRRAAAAVDAFRPLMSDPPRGLNRWLKRIRRAAGPARDADVMLLRLAALEEPTPLTETIVGWLHRDRAAAQQKLLAVERKSRKGKFRRSIDRCLASLDEWHSGSQPPAFAEFARTALASAVHTMFGHEQPQQPTVEQLHELRIAGKALRYSIEIFANAFPVELRDEIYPVVEKTQSRLGELNDHVTAQRQMQQWLALLPPDARAAELAEQVTAEHATAKQLRKEFLKWWNNDRGNRLQQRLLELVKDKGQQ